MAKLLGNFQANSRCFPKILHCLEKFYRTAGPTGPDKSQVCMSPRNEVWLLTNEGQPMIWRLQYIRVWLQITSLTCTYICTTTCLSHIHWNSEPCFDRSQSLSYFIVKLAWLAVFHINDTFPHFCAIWHFIRIALIHAFSFLFIGPKYNQYLALALSEGLKKLFKKWKTFYDICLKASDHFLLIHFVTQP